MNFSTQHITNLTQGKTIQYKVLKGEGECSLIVAQTSDTKKEIYAVFDNSASKNLTWTQGKPETLCEVKFQINKPYFVKAKGKVVWCCPKCKKFEINSEENKMKNPVAYELFHPSTEVKLCPYANCSYELTRMQSEKMFNVWKPLQYTITSIKDTKHEWVLKIKVVK